MKYLIIALLIIVGAEILVMAVFYPEENLRKMFAAEQNSLSGELSAEDQIFVAGFARTAEDSVLHQSGLAGGIRAIFLPSDDQKKKSGNLSEMGQGMFEKISKRFSLMSELFYEYMLRIGTVLVCFRFCIAVFVLSLISGILKRKIRQNTFAGTSSVRQTIAVRGLFAVCYISLLADLSPFVFGITSLTVQCLSAGFFLCMTVTNMQKRI